MFTEILKGQRIDKLKESVIHKKKTANAAVQLITLKTGDISQYVGNTRDLEKRQILVFHFTFFK